MSGAETIEHPRRAGAKRKHIWRALGAALLSLTAPPAAAAPSFNHDAALTTDTGHMLIEWESDRPVTLEIAREPDFSTGEPLYRGGNHAYFLSGLAEGEYFLRLRNNQGEISEPITLSVEHQSLQQAIWLTVIGAIITAGIAVTILRGARP